jgi:hypothetical protein
MKLTTNHKDKQINAFIMDYLYDHEGLQGNEEYLVDQLFTEFLSQSDIITLEVKLSEYFDYAIDLPKDLKLIELK